MEIFKVIFEALSDKWKIEWRRVHNVDDEEEEMHLDQALELNWRWWRWIKNEEMGEIAKRSQKSMFFIAMRNETEWALAAAHQGKSENWFCMTMWNFRTVMRNAPGRQNSCWCIFHFAQSCELVGARAKPYFL